MMGQSQHVPLAMFAFPLSIYHLNVPWERRDRVGTFQHAPLPILYCHCPSHPNVPWEGRDGVGTSQHVPLAMPAFPLSFPSQCTVVKRETAQHIPLPILYCHCLSHPNVPWKEGMEWEHPNVYHYSHACVYNTLYKM